MSKPILMNNLNRMLLALILAIFLSCNFSAQEQKDITEEQAEKSEMPVVNENWVMALANVTSLPENEFLTLLPQRLLGLPLGKSVPDKLSAVRGTYSKDLKPNYKSTSISLVIVDGAGDVGLEHMNTIYNLLKSDLFEDFGDSWGKTTSYKGMRVLVKDKTTKGYGSIPPRKTSEVEFIKDNRFHILLGGNHMDSKTLLKAAEEVHALAFPKK